MPSPRRPISSITLAQPSQEEASAARAIPIELASRVVDAQSTATAAASLTAGLRVVGRESYVVEGEYARGGVGRVLLAHDPCLDRPVALKEVLRDDPGTLARFVREARLTARLQHPNIVPVYEAGRWPSGEPFYAMRLLSGRSLGSVVAAMGSLEERLSLVPSLVAIADAVAYAHSLRIIHRDLKPQNVVVGAFGETVVIDWGLAKDLGVDEDEDAAFSPAVSAVGAALTVVGARVGTPAYMAPEQARGEPVDERADVFALGALMYHVLTGEPRFAGRTTEEVLALAAAAAPTDIEIDQPGVPRDLAPIVRKAMAARPADRYPTARELADDLRRFQTGQLVSARRYSRWSLLQRWLRRHRVIVGLAAATLAALVVITTVSLRRIVSERDRAQARTGELILAQARLSLDHDPTAAAAWLKSYPVDAPGWSAARVLADDARYAGVARHVFGTPADVGFGLAFDGIGRQLVSANAGQLLRWDVATGTRVHDARFDGFSVAALVPGSGAVVFATRDGGLDLLPAQGGAARRIDAVSGGVRALQISSDGRWVAAAGESAIFVDSIDGEGRRRLAMPPTAVLSLALTSDGARLAAVTENRTVWVWDTSNPAPRKLDGLIDKSAPILFLPGSARLVGASEEGTLLVWSAITGETQALRGDRHALVALAASPDGARLASANALDEVRLWDLASGEGPVIGAHRGRVLGLGFSPDGALLASSAQDEVVHLYRLETGETSVLRGHGAVDGLFAFSPDGKLLATAGGSELRVWPVHPPTGRTLRGHDERVTHAVFSPDGRQLATCGGHDVILWDVATGKLARRGTHEADVYGLSFSPDGRVLASSSYDATVRLWDTHGEGVRVLRGHNGRVRDVVFSPDGSTLATAGRDGTVRLWNSASGDARVLGRLEGQVARVAFSPDGRQLVTVGQDRFVRLWDVTTGAQRALGSHDADPFQVSFLGDGAQVLSADDNDARLWDVTTGRMRLLPRVIDFDGRIAASPDGRVAALPSGNRIVLVDLSTFEQRVLVGHDRPVRRCRFSHDGRRLVSVSIDGTMRLWELATGAARIVHRHDGVIFDASFSPDDSLVASAGVDKTAWIGPTDADADDPLPTEPAALRAALGAVTTAAVGAGDQVRTP